MKNTRSTLISQQKQQISQKLISNLSARNGRTTDQQKKWKNHQSTETETETGQRKKKTNHLARKRSTTVIEWENKSISNDWTRIEAEAAIFSPILRAEARNRSSSKTQWILWAILLQQEALIMVIDRQTDNHIFTPKLTVTDQCPGRTKQWTDQNAPKE